MGSVVTTIAVKEMTEDELEIFHSPQTIPQLKRTQKSGDLYSMGDYGDDLSPLSTSGVVTQTITFQ